MSDLTSLNLHRAIQGLRQGEFSCRELIQAYLERIQLLDLDLNAYLFTDPEGALKQAEAADQRLAEWRKFPQTELPPLLGIPLAVKDILCVKGMPCTCGSKILEGFVPPYHATAVERLLAAGAIILGKTNTDEFAMGSSTENSAYGVTRNPWNRERVPGGSSGGSAAAVAARLAPVALGTDTGGSVRQPASFCGVSGLKPTYGRVSRYGLVAYGSSLDVVGVFGREMQEIALIYELMAGVDPRDATTVDLPVPHIDLNQNIELSNLRIGVPKEYFLPGMQPQVEQAIREAIRHLQALGAQVEEISLPHTEYALPVYYLIAPAEASANLARYDGIRYGPRLSAATMWDIFYRTRGEKFGAEVKRRIMLGTYALSAGYYDAYYGKAQKVRTLIKQDFERAFQTVDVIAAPIAPTTAFPIGEHTDDPLAMYLEDVFTLPANLAGVPGLAFPVGFDQQGLPIGMQLMGSYFQEELLFRIAHAYQLTTDWHLRTP
ncbi:MAG: Asp-tRNA(Asn)/Glu-tRNA(Gln) amidotransferase GatCAB subunit A [Anaerolineae bacterium]|jgi:aspartyl-tRNA(Asn)/glutamyl-tRNA(Gln) amidotransferase subunit A|nr:MAG: Asp-tRNA(Asn)/Glu-tRNA(Gln) amidotransferase GatCAB subunit A [Anaerolineae bacterium]